MYHKEMLSKYLGDRIAYRSLEPSDATLPSLRKIWPEVGLDEYRIPRKTEPVYAAVVMKMLEAAQASRGQAPLRDLLFIGDTLMNDGTAAQNLSQTLPLRGFIGADRLESEPEISCDGPLMISNRWGHLQDYLQWAQEEGIGCDQRTAVLVDIDKTFVGARGRNDKVIDGVRVDAVRQIIEEVLGGDFDRTSFVQVYDELSQPEYHQLTSDNQDYLAYISLMVTGNIFPANEFWAELKQGYLTGFTQFVTLCDARRSRMGKDLSDTHQEVVSNLRQGDPTPFKSFRYREYFTTVAAMDRLPDNASREDLLNSEILITEEVALTLDWLTDRGVLTFGISDKPDEASTPPSQLAQEMAQPIHRVTMKVMGAN